MPDMKVSGFRYQVSGIRDGPGVRLIPGPRLTPDTRYLIPVSYLPGEADSDLSLLLRLRGPHAAEIGAAGAGLVAAADAAEIVASEQVEHLADQFDLAAAAKLDRLAGAHVDTRQRVLVDLAFRDRREAERCAGGIA